MRVSELGIYFQMLIFETRVLGTHYFTIMIAVTISLH